MHSRGPILLIEDDAVDAMTVRRAMREIDVTKRLIHVADGEQGLRYLRDSNNVKPCIILLDLNMPRMNGIEFLKVLRADEKLRHISVVVLTTSRADHDKIECFGQSVAGYIVKPVDYDGFLNAMGIFNLYWTLSELPDATAETKDVKLDEAVCN